MDRTQRDTAGPADVPPATHCLRCHHPIEDGQRTEFSQWFSHHSTCPAPASSARGCDTCRFHGALEPTCPRPASFGELIGRRDDLAIIDDPHEGTR